MTELSEIEFNEGMGLENLVIYGIQPAYTLAHMIYEETGSDIFLRGKVSLTILIAGMMSVSLVRITAVSYLSWKASFKRWIPNQPNPSMCLKA